MEYGFEAYKPSEILRGHIDHGCDDNGKETIRVNSRYFELNGEPWIGVMGEIHFSRIPREEWRDRLLKMKAGGISIVATYIFWIYHEEIEGKYDFTGNQDLRAFVREAEAVGLKVVIRIGPWAHGECRNGGFPDWLCRKGIKLRSNDEQYMVYVKDWYEHIYNEVKGLFFKDGGNIIGVQFENELVDAPEHLSALKKLALEIGYDAPVYTATGWNSKFGAKIPVDEMIPVFAAYADAPWAAGIKKLAPSPHYVFDPRRNDSSVGSDVIKDDSTASDGWRLPYERYPFALCELGPGLQPTHLRRAVLSDMDAYTVSLVKLGCGNNLIGYYMYAGGTNKVGALSTLQETKLTGYPNDYTAINYDFHTALTQYGEVNPRYGMLNLLHMFVADFGNVLAPMENVSAAIHSDSAYGVLSPENTEDLRYAKRTDGKSGFVFVNHYQRYKKLTDKYNVAFVTDGVKFPEIDVKGDVCFFFPYNMELNGMKLEYATAQPVCHIGDTYFFAGIDGITPKFKFEGMDEFSVEAFKLDENAKEAPAVKPVYSKNSTGAESVRICVISFESAKYLRKFGERVVLGHFCNLYEDAGELHAIEGREFYYTEFKMSGADIEEKVAKVTESGTVTQNIADDKTDFSDYVPSPDLYKETTELIPVTSDKCRLADVREMLDYSEVIVNEMAAELHVPEDTDIVCMKVKVTSAEGYVSISDRCDVQMLIANGKLVADRFYDGLAWRVPAKLIYNKDCVLIMTPERDDIFME